MGKAIKYQELRRQYDLLGGAATCKHLEEALAARHVVPEDFSVRDLCEALVPDGREFMRAIAPRKSGGMSLLEAANAVDTSAFANITGQIVFNKIKEEFENPEFLWPQLCETVNTEFLDGERIPGIGGVGDKAEIVDEGMPYPNVGLNEEYLDIPGSVKRGFIVPVTREIIIADRTGVLLKRAGDTGKWLGFNKEKRVLDVALGIVNNYKRNGTATNTYLTSGAYVNSVGDTLVDYTDVENAWLLFDAITDPNHGEFIVTKPDTLIVPSALVMTALRIVNATSVQHVDMQVNASTFRYESPNPLGRLGALKVLSSPYVKSRTSSATTWFFGQPKKAFAYYQVWDIETLQAASNSEAEFTQDIMMRFKASERGVAVTVEPRYMTKLT